MKMDAHQHYWRLNQTISTEEIYQILKRDILTHKMPTGKRININQLARTLEVSNIQIREAFTRLQSEGYLHSVPFKGIYVNLLSQQELNELYEIRLQLEPFAVERATRVIPEEKLNWLYEYMINVCDRKLKGAKSGLELINEMNLSLHGTILQYCDNISLQNLLKGYIEQIQRYLVYIRLKLIVDDTAIEWAEHSEVLFKLLQRDAQGASVAMAIHIRNSQKRTIAHFISTGM
jgi:DNA-binding GntR family transcriptional regulator